MRAAALVAALTDEDDMSPSNDAACAVCGAEHDPEESPEVDSTHLCPTCAANERALRDEPGANHEPPAPYRPSRQRACASW